MRAADGAPAGRLCHHLKLHSEDSSLWPDHKHMTSLSFDAEIRGIKGHPCHTSPRANGIPTHSVTAAVHSPEPMFCGGAFHSPLTIAALAIWQPQWTRIWSVNHGNQTKNIIIIPPPPQKEARVINLYDQSTKIVGRIWLELVPMAIKTPRGQVGLNCERRAVLLSPKWLTWGCGSCCDPGYGAKNIHHQLTFCTDPESRWRRILK